MQKHGIILVDEISVREALTVCSKTLTFKGLVDYGEEYKTTNINEKATSGLVFMFQPLADTYCQPVAIFAAKGSVISTPSISWNFKYLLTGKINQDKLEVSKHRKQVHKIHYIGIY